MRAISVAIALLATGCAVSPATTTTASSPSVVSERAARVYREAIVIDTHNDMPSKMIDDGYDADIRHTPGFEKTNGETDFPRLLESGVTGVFMSAYIDPEKWTFRTPDQSWEQVGVYLDTIHAFVNRHPDRLLFATTGEQIRQAKRDGKVAILIGVERSEEHTSELQSRLHLVCRLLLEKKKTSP